MDGNGEGMHLLLIQARTGRHIFFAPSDVTCLWSFGQGNHRPSVASFNLSYPIDKMDVGGRV